MSGSPAAVGAFAVARGVEGAEVFLADSPETLDRALAVHLVARFRPETASSPAKLQEMRAALLDERWGDALAAWIDETGVPVDVYAHAPALWTEGELTREKALLEIKVSPVFRDE